jgi:hypothetical protein
MAAVQNRIAGSLGCTLPATEARDADGDMIVTVVPEQRLDRDFILRWGIAADTVATTTLLVEPDNVRPAGLGSGKPAEEAPGDGTFSLVIVPPAQVADVKQAASVCCALRRDIVEKVRACGGQKFQSGYFFFSIFAASMYSRTPLLLTILDNINTFLLFLIMLIFLKYLGSTPDPPLIKNILLKFSFKILLK